MALEREQAVGFPEFPGLVAVGVREALPVHPQEDCRWTKSNRFLPMNTGADWFSRAKAPRCRSCRRHSGGRRDPASPISFSHRAVRGARGAARQLLQKLRAGAGLAMDRFFGPRARRSPIFSRSIADAGKVSRPCEVSTCQTRPFMQASPVGPLPRRNCRRHEFSLAFVRKLRRRQYRITRNRRGSECCGAWLDEGAEDAAGELVRAAMTASRIEVEADDGGEELVGQLVGADRVPVGVVEGLADAERKERAGAAGGSRTRLSGLPS